MTQASSIHFRRLHAAYTGTAQGETPDLHAIDQANTHYELLMRGGVVLLQQEVSCDEAAAQTTLRLVRIVGEAAKIHHAISQVQDNRDVLTRARNVGDIGFIMSDRDTSIDRETCGMILTWMKTVASVYGDNKAQGEAIQRRLIDKMMLAQNSLRDTGYAWRGASSPALRPAARQG